MSFFQPEKVPVKLYLSTDKDAPRLDRTPNCVQTILKACLVTGYGEKEPAGWSLPFEDNDKGIKVLKPADSPHIPFFMRLSQDTGREMTVQVYQNMTSVDDGELKLQCDTPFKYGIQHATQGRWAVIACDRAFWFFHETAKEVTPTKSGVYLYLGDTTKNTRGERAVYLKHTGGAWGLHDKDRLDILSLTSYGGSTKGQFFYEVNTIIHADPQSFFTGTSAVSTRTLLSPVLIMQKNEVWALPAFSPSTTTQDNYELIKSHGRTFLNHSTATKYVHNFLVPTDYWEF